MSSAPMIILYVASPAESASFYSRLLGSAPVDSSPNFAMFALEGGVMLGLWARRDVQPAPTTQAGAMEVGFIAADDAAVRERHAQWAAQGVPMLQAPVTMDFGYTFTATDPDGHRLRVFAPKAV